MYFKIQKYTYTSGNLSELSKLFHQDHETCKITDHAPLPLKIHHLRSRLAHVELQFRAIHREFSDVFQVI